MEEGHRTRCGAVAVLAARRLESGARPCAGAGGDSGGGGPVAAADDATEAFRWVIAQACAQGRAWMDAGTPIRVAVNLSPRQFGDDLVPTITRCLAEHTVEILNLLRLVPLVKNRHLRAMQARQTCGSEAAASSTENGKML